MALDQSEFRALLHRYQAGECSPVEAGRVEHWYRGLGSDARAGLSLTAPEQAALVASVWQRIAAETTAAPYEAPVPPHRAGAWAGRRRVAAAAAGLVLGAALAGTYLGHRSAPAPEQAATRPAGAAAAWVVRTNTTAAAARVALPDGSAVTLAPASTLRYPTAFGGPRRAVYLSGGAFFRVFHDAAHPFSVYTDQVVTTVLGTSFDVRAYAGQPEVQVQVRTGRVRVRPRAAAGPATPALVLLPNQQAVYSAARRQLRRELVARPALLAPQSFVFTDRPVAEVLAALEKAYGVPIEYDAAALRNCTLTLALGAESLFDKLGVVCETLGARYEQADGRILFHASPCPAE